MRGALILEGVTGTGKSSTLAAVVDRARSAGIAVASTPEARAAAVASASRRLHIFHEEETFGELLDELRRPDLTDEDRCARLHRLLAVVRADLAAGDRAVLLERFHPSYYAMMPTFGLYAAIDRALADLSCRIVLLDVPDAELARRAIRRVDREGTDWLDGMIGYFGSEAGALDAALTSQRRRREVLSLSALPSLVLDTTAMDWGRCADEVLAFWRGDRAR